MKDLIPNHRSELTSQFSLIKMEDGGFQLISDSSLEIVDTKKTTNKSDSKVKIESETDLNIETSDTREICSVCGKSVKYLKKHVRIQHQTLKKPEQDGLCPVCGKFFKNVADHLRSHKKDFFCGQCCAIFKSARRLEEHVEIHNNNPHVCGTCKMVFKTLTDLALHNYCHTNTYSCPKCKAVCQTRQALKYHVKKEEENFNYHCHICGQGFVQQHLLEWHIEKHENVKKYECEICHKKFILKAYLKSHRRFNHKKELFGVEEVFQCKMCDRKFSFECSLKRHTNLVHKIGKERSVVCKVCQKVFTTTYSHTVHMRLHTGEKKYSCTLCDEGFARYQYLTRHMARRHGVKKGKIQYQE